MKFGVLLKSVCMAILFAALIPCVAIAEEGGADETARMDRIKSLVVERSVADKSAQTAAQQNIIPSKTDESSGGVRMMQGLLLCTGMFFIGIFLYRKITG